MDVKFWGTRGSIPTPEPEYMKYGGDTPCLEITTSDDKHLILDAGTGIRRLGNDLIARAKGEPIHADILMTHGHWDHIQGFPFFAPAYIPGNQFAFYGLFKADGRLEESLRGMMGKLYFPVHLDSLAAELSFQDILEGTRDTNGFQVTNCAVNHPQGAVAYRVEHDGAAVVYVPDTEHTPDDLQPKLVELSRGAEYLIHDCHFTPEEYESHRDWGHSSYQTAVALAREAEVRTLVIYHHAPEHTDDQMDEILARVRDEWPHVIAATRDRVISTHGSTHHSPSINEEDLETAEWQLSQGYSIEKDGDELSVMCPASNTVFASTSFREEVTQRIDDSVTKVRMDFSKVVRLTSTSIAPLGRIVTHCWTHQIPIVFTGVNAKVKAVLEVTRFTQMVDIQEASLPA